MSSMGYRKHEGSYSVGDPMRAEEFTPLPARAEDLRRLVEWVEGLEQRVRELERIRAAS